MDKHELARKVVEACRKITGMSWPRDQFDFMNYGFTPELIEVRDALDAFDAAPDEVGDDVESLASQMFSVMECASGFNDAPWPPQTLGARGDPADDPESAEEWREVARFILTRQRRREREVARRAYLYGLAVGLGEDSPEDFGPSSHPADQEGEERAIAHATGSEGGTPDDASVIAAAERIVDKCLPKTFSGVEFRAEMCDFIYQEFRGLISGSAAEAGGSDA